MTEDDRYFEARAIADAMTDEEIEAAIAAADNPTEAQIAANPWQYATVTIDAFHDELARRTPKEVITPGEEGNMTDQPYPWPSEHGAPFLAWWDQADEADRRRYVETAVDWIVHNDRFPLSPSHTAPFGAGWYALNVVTLIHRYRPDTPVDWQRAQDLITRDPSRALVIYDWIMEYPE